MVLLGCDILLCCIDRVCCVVLLGCDILLCYHDRVCCVVLLGCVTVNGSLVHFIDDQMGVLYC